MYKEETKYKRYTKKFTDYRPYSSFYVKEFH